MRGKKLVFAGTPDFACPSLRALHDAGHEIALVITQPDRPRGRGCRITAPAVKIEAERLELEIIQPELLDSDGMHSRLGLLAPEAVIIVAYGQKIPPWLLALPPLGCLNVHASLLPAYRGAAPIQRAILNGATHTGVTIMQLDAGWDTGPLINQEIVDIDPLENAGSLHDRLAAAGAVLLIKALSGLASGALKPVCQDGALATIAPKIKGEETRISWRESAARLHNLVRALAPAPLAETFHGEKRLQIIRTEPRAHQDGGNSGDVIQVSPEGVFVQTGHGILLLTEVKPENGRVMTAAAYARGHRLLPGVRLK